MENNNSNETQLEEMRERVGMKNDTAYYSTITNREKIALINALNNGLGDEIKGKTQPKDGWFKRLIDKII